MKHFEQGVVILSIDTERMWGYSDLLSEGEFHRNYQDAVAVHDLLLDCLSSSRLSATWAVVGGLALEASEGAGDHRMRGIPGWWTRRIPCGNQRTAPLWYARDFVRRLVAARPQQDIGLHGGLTHLIWSHPHATADVAQRELRAGLDTLAELSIRPRSFVFPRDLEAHHHLLRDAGIDCYRGRAPVLSEGFGFSRFGACVRAAEEIVALTPPVVWPRRTLRELWNVPASMSLYSMRRSRSLLAPFSLRAKRVCLGMEAAARQRGIFHLALHPENLAESAVAMLIFESIVEEIARWRDRGDIAVLTMSGAVDAWKNLTKEALVA